ncbi:carbohydrate-binding family 9-like protein [Calditrichota bacterium GD2]
MNNKEFMVKEWLFLLIFVFSGFAQTVRIPDIEFSPEKYICFHSGSRIIIDGKLDEAQWEKAKWTKDFVDIRGRKQAKPRFCTKVKMLWDDKYFYVAAYLEEPHIWGKLKSHDDTLYKDNNFEVFIDPDGDTGKYCEVEINALNTIWDLLLIKPYRDMKQPDISNWEIKGLKSKVTVWGSLNNPNDKDSCWTIEIALPWTIFKELADVSIPPQNGDQWRVNFSRVEWQVEAIGGAYKKRINPVTGKPMPDFWVWSPQGLVNMHYPEMWGYVQFSTEIVGSGEVEFIEKEEEKARWYLRQIYYKEKIYYKKHNKYTANLNELGIKERSLAGYVTPPVIECTSDLFEASLIKKDKKTKLGIRNDGLIFISQVKH